MEAANNIMKLVILFCLIGASLAIPTGSQDSFLKEIAAAKQEKKVTKFFDEQMVSLEGRNDKFYFVDEHAHMRFSNVWYMDGKITLGGQAISAEQNVAEPSSYPFAFGQRSTTMFKSLMERWDVKDVGDGKTELFAIYRGQGKPFVLNKVRAHLLRHLANALQPLVPILDRTMQKSATNPDEVIAIQDEITMTIEKVFAEVDSAARSQMNTNDDSSASATVVMVTEGAIVVASVGDGKVLGYDDNTIVRTLNVGSGDEQARNLFGFRKSRIAASVVPHVEIYNRQKDNIQLILMESPIVSNSITPDKSFLYVLNTFSQNKLKPDNEQYMYSNSVSQILHALATEKTGGLGQVGKVVNYFKRRELTVGLIGLTRNYEEIH